MSIELTKSQKQSLGQALRSAGFTPDAFVYSEISTDQGKDAAALTNRESSDKFVIINNPSGTYSIAKSIPGTRKTERYGSLSWNELLLQLELWSKEVKSEIQAVDPWQQEAKDMADDDSYFSLDELPKVDNAIERSLDELKTQALNHGKTLEQITAGLQQAEQLLKKTARSSTKKEWISLFKGIIIEKLIDWGMQSELFQNILHTLITSAHDITQLAEHASRHLP
jgi:hypothetical protein